jgi:hypothetical protein
MRVAKRKRPIERSMYLYHRGASIDCNNDDYCDINTGCPLYGGKQAAITPLLSLRLTFEKH